MRAFSAICLTYLLLISIGCSAIVSNETKDTLVTEVVSDEKVPTEGVAIEEIAICEYIYNYMKELTDKRIEPTLLDDSFLNMEGVLILASFRDDYSDTYLVKLRYFYIGAALAGYLSDIIVKRDKKILPALHALKEKISVSICNPEFYSCLNHVSRAERLISRINEQDTPNLTTDNVGDPFSYIPKEEIKARFDLFKSKVESKRNEFQRE